MEQAYFKNIRSEIIRCLKQSTDEVLIAMAWFTSCELFQELLNCLRRKVKVNLVLLDDATNFMYYAPDFNQLIEAGGEMRIIGMDCGFMHHKFCVIDRKMVITGSYNWTYYAETRNVENIIITDNSSVIEQYLGEFTSLFSRTKAIDKSPRLDWTDIGACPSVNFEELNYEIGQIAKTRNLPECKVFKAPKPVVKVIDTPLNPKSKYDVQICLNEGWKKLIKEETSLPYTKTFDFLSYKEDRNGMRFVLGYSNEDPEQDCILFDKSISILAEGQTDEVLKIRIQVNLDTTGYLHVAITCLETGKTLDFQDTNIKYVEYE